MIFVFVLDGEVLLGVAVLLALPELLGAPELLGVSELPGFAVTRVSVFAAVPPCGFTDWDAVVPAGLLPAAAPELAGAFTF